MSFKLTIGKVSRLGIPAYHNEAIVSVIPATPELDPFLFMFLPSFAAGGTANAAIKGMTLNSSSLAQIPIALPPLPEQRRLLQTVDQILRLVDDLEAGLVDRDQLRVALAATVPALVFD